MIPVDQAIVSNTKGDCWSACLASILELPLEDVPKFVWHFGEHSDRAAELWLSRLGYSYIRLERYIKTEDERYFWHATGFNVWHSHDTYCILSGHSPNFKGGFHAVVGQIGHNGDLTVVHDPSPFKKGILGAPVYLSLLAAKNPAELKKPKYVPELSLDFFN